MHKKKKKKDLHGGYGSDPGTGFDRARPDLYGSKRDIERSRYGAMANRGWESRETSPRNMSPRRYTSSQNGYSPRGSPERGYRTRSPDRFYPDQSYPGYSVEPPRLPPMDHRIRGVDPYHPAAQWHAPVIGGYHYDKTGLVAARNRNGEYGVLGRWYKQRKDSPWSVLFIVLGLFLLVCGAVNTMFCIDYHYYSSFWTGFVVSIPSLPHCFCLNITPFESFFYKHNDRIILAVGAKITIE